MVLGKKQENSLPSKRVNPQKKVENLLNFNIFQFRFLHITTYIIKQL